MTISWLLMFAVCAPIVIFGIVFAGDILNLWLGQSYAVHSKNIFIILLVGFLFNALAQVPFTAIQSVGKAKITALLHCIEIIPYFVMLYFCTALWADWCSIRLEYQGHRGLGNFDGY